MISLFFVAATALAGSPVSQEFKNFDSYLFDLNDTGVRKGKRTDGALVIKEGKTLYEKYDRGYDEHKKHIMWSVSKTAMALIMGVAERDGKAKRNQSICDFIKDLKPDHCKIKIQDLLQWSSGLQWREDYEEAPTPRMSSVIAMLYGEGRNDMAKFVADQDFEPGQEPGKMWRYSSGDSILLSAVLAQVFQGRDLRDVFKEEIYEPLGIKDWLWESDAKGTLSGAYYFFISVRDLAKMGKVFLGHGTVDGKKIMNGDFVDFMATVPESFKTNPFDHGNSRSISGAHLWVNSPHVPGMDKPWPTAPDDTVVAIGHWGQYLVVIPSLKLIAVRVGDTRDQSFGTDMFMAKLIEAVTGNGAPREIIYSKKKTEKKNTRLYKDGIMKLGLRFTAHAFCSCLFVSENTEEACRAYASLAQVSPKLSVDFPKKQTKSTLFFILSDTAQYFSGQGCR